MPNNYNSSFTGQHNDEYDARITALENFRQTFLSTVYPVGSIYISMNETDPGTLFGGTWDRISGRFLLGCGGTGPGANNSTGFGTLTTAQEVWFSDLQPGSTGGEYFHTLSVAEMPTHRHDINKYVGMVNSTNAFVINDSNFDGLVASDCMSTTVNSKPLTDAQRAQINANTGDSQQHNNIPPYLTVSMWKRIA